MNKTLLFLFLYLFSFSSSVLVKAQCSLHPIIAPDDLILCPNTSDTLYVTKEFDSYQWFRFNKAIPGATQRYLPVNAFDDGGALFKVIVTKNGCTDTSKKVLVDGYVFAGPVTVTNGNSSYFDVKNGISVFCKNEPVSLFFPDPYSTNIQWYNNSEPIPGANSQTYKVTRDGSYTVTGSPEVCPNYEVCQCIPVNIAIDKFSVSVSRSCDTLMANKGVSFQWYLNGNEIPGATSIYYLPIKKGLYSVDATDRYNCSSLSAPLVYTPANNRIVISPNPADSYVTFNINVDNAAQVVISDVYGNRRMQIAANSGNQRIQVSNLSSGTYVLQFLDKTGNVIASEKFMKN